MKIALIQTNPQTDFNANLTNMTAHIHKAAQMGADLVICPETFLFMGPEQERKKFGQKLENLDSEHERTHSFGTKNAFTHMQLLAQELDIYLIAGTIDELQTHHSHDLNVTLPCKQRPHGSHDPIAGCNDSKFYNTCTTFDPNGKMISKYRKLHLFNLLDDQGNPLYCESNIYESGSLPSMYKIQIQDEIWDALNIICYDIRFPEIIRHLHKHCDVIFVPAAFTWQTGHDHWEVLLRARAIENQCFVVACNQTGFSHEGQKRNFGHSMVVDPWGKVVAALDEKEGILFCEISKAGIVHGRSKLPALQDRKIF